MKQTTKRLLLFGGISFAIVTGYTNYRWFTHKVDASVEKSNDGGAKLDSIPKRLNEEELRKKDFGVPKGIPYKPRKSLIKLEQSG